VPHLRAELCPHRGFSGRIRLQHAADDQDRRARGALRELLWNADEATRTLSELCARNGIQHAQVGGPRH
jgi:hypothetical protein